LEVSKTYRFQVHDITGKLVSNGDVIHNRIEILHLPHSTYFITLLSNNEVVLKSKFIKL
jgi:hypothetical protein